MARITYTGLVASIDGSIGGLTFQNNHSGSIVRTRPIKSKKTSLYQQSSIQSHILFLHDWQNLNSDQQGLWNDYAELYTKTNKFGVVKHLTGANWFESINYNLLKAGSAFVNVPPIHTLPSSVFSYYLSIQENGIFIIFNSVFSPANSVLYIWCTAPFISTNGNLYSQLRLIKVISSFPVTVIDITSDFNSYFNFSDILLNSDSVFYIHSLLQLVEKTSGLAGAGLSSSFKFNSFEQGIGYWIINRDFIVT